MTVLANAVASLPLLRLRLFIAEDVSMTVLTPLRLYLYGDCVCYSRRREHSGTNAAAYGVFRYCWVGCMSCVDWGGRVLCYDFEGRAEDTALVHMA